MRGPRSIPTALHDAQMARIRTAWIAVVNTNTFSIRRRVRAVVVDALVERAQRPLDAQPDEQRPQLREQRAGGAREEEDDEHDRPEDERPLQPEVGVDVVVADREHEPDRAEEHGRRAAEPPLDA